ncbi:MAG: hypothetical protein DBY36_02250 [Clostridiales bacterium]|nr:MAG: hypothetical protein DBY36_02250 [Clostridiales bacterium]
MTDERKNELYDQMIAWICENIQDDRDLFAVLHGQFGMTKEEMHDHCIESLDDLFDDRTISENAAFRVEIETQRNACASLDVEDYLILSSIVQESLENCDDDPSEYLTIKRISEALNEAVDVYFGETPEQENEDEDELEP